MSIVSIAKSAYKALPSIKTVKRAVKTVPSILFEDGADVLVRGARDSFKAGIKNNLSIKKSLLKGLKEGGGNLALNVAKKTRTSGSVFSRIFSSIKSTPKDLIAATKGGAAAAKAAGKSGILGGLKGLGKGFWSKMPLIGNLMLIGFELPNIFKATKEQGVGQGVAEVAKALKVNRNFVYKIIKDGELEAVKVGSIKVKKEALTKYVNNQIYNARKEENSLI